MANWVTISRNAKTHGHFAGRTTAEQDAYFEFFGGSDRSGLKVIFLTVGRVFTKVRNVYSARGLRFPFAEIASSK
ncbi:hypothetical protein shim_23500 [Shimia sp. SK013]|nr:hypothetical protein shim_23500 [Shimia sp. SK013]